MIETAHHTIYRNEYTAPDYRIDSIDLRFELGDEVTIVSSKMAVRAAHDTTSGTRPLILNGKNITMRGVTLDGETLDQSRYTATGELLTILSVPAVFTLEVTTELRPQDNTALEGLYRSGGMFCTQCEAEGFRAITYYLDRPDVLTLFTTKTTSLQATQ